MSTAHMSVSQSGQLLGIGSLLLPQDPSSKLTFVDKCSYLLSHLAGPATNDLTSAQGHSLQWAGVKCPVRPEVLRLWFPDVWLSSPLGAGGTRKQLWAAGPGRLHLPGCSQLCGSAGNSRASFPRLLTKAPSRAHESVGPQEFP